MSVRVVNTLTYQHIDNEVFIRVDRTSILGNPFKMKQESDRETVCQKYEEYFNKLIAVDTNHDTKFLKELDKIEELAKSHNVALACWCNPNRCHGDTIKHYLDRRLSKPQCSSV